jgi:hypothetical protein
VPGGPPVFKTGEPCTARLAGSIPVRLRADPAAAPRGPDGGADHGWLPQGIDGVLQRGMEWVMYTTAGLLSGAPRPVSIPAAIRAAAPRPVLIIAAGAVADEPVAARWFQAASPATVHMWVLPHAGHTQGLATAPPRLGNPRDQLPERGPAPTTTARQGAGNNG